MEKKVLLIDDEPSLIRHVALSLMQKGYDTEPCENGMRGWKRYRCSRRSGPLSTAPSLISDFWTWIG